SARRSCASSRRATWTSAAMPASRRRTARARSKRPRRREGKGVRGAPPFYLARRSAVLAFHVLGHHVEQAAGLGGVQVRVEIHLEDALPGPVPALEVLFGVDDDAEESRSPHEFVDEFLAGVECEVRRLHCRLLGWEKVCPGRDAGAYA